MSNFLKGRHSKAPKSNLFHRLNPDKPNNPFKLGEFSFYRYIYVIPLARIPGNDSDKTSKIRGFLLHQPSCWLAIATDSAEFLLL